jgi:hypothetical protein
VPLRYRLRRRAHTFRFSERRVEKEGTVLEQMNAPGRASRRHQEIAVRCERPATEDRTRRGQTSNIEECHMPSTLPTHVAEDRGRGLRRLLGTFNPDVFLRDYFGERMLHIAGTRGRWDDLFGWRELDTVLNSGLLPYPRVRLVKDGGLIEPAAYTFTVGDRQWPDSERCQRFMAEGATLVVQSVERASPRLDAFARSLAYGLCGDVRVDVVATCAPVPGLKMHWDNAECFNLQIDGAKEWQVTRPERPYPLTPTSLYPQRRDVTTSLAPQTAPTWTGSVAPGDLIYLPRGWWHAVSPRVTPSLHLSVAVEVPTLCDVLHWFAQHAAKYDEARRIVPVWQSATERRSHTEALFAAVAGWLGADVLDEYLDHSRTSGPSHPDFALPALSTTGGQPLRPSTRVRFRARTPLHWSVEEGWLKFEWRGQRHRFNAQVLPVLEALTSFDAISVEELSQITDRVLARAFILTLLASGLLSITSEYERLSAGIR